MVQKVVLENFYEIHCGFLTKNGSWTIEKIKKVAIRDKSGQVTEEAQWTNAAAENPISKSLTNIPPAKTPKKIRSVRWSVTDSAQKLTRPSILANKIMS